MQLQIANRWLFGDLVYLRKTSKTADISVVGATKSDESVLLVTTLSSLIDCIKFWK